MLNALWIVMQFQFEYVSVAFPRLQVPIGLLYDRPDQKVQILGVIFLILFTLVLMLQFLSMLFHRWGTIVEILASTRLYSKHHKYRDTRMTIRDAVDLIKEMELEKNEEILNLLKQHNKLKNGGNKHNVVIMDPSSQTTGSSLDNEYDAQMQEEPDPDYSDEDILPEPEPDYFEHPAVNNETNWNEPLRAFSYSQRNQFNMNLSNNSYNYNRELLMSPTMRYYNQASSGDAQGDSKAVISPPRLGALKPLQSLDARVMRQFRVLEQRDPRFKRKVRQIQHQYSATRLHGGNSPNPPNDVGYHV